MFYLKEKNTMTNIHFQCDCCQESWNYTSIEIRKNKINCPTLLCQYCEEELCEECMEVHECGNPAPNKSKFIENNQKSQKNEAYHRLAQRINPQWEDAFDYIDSLP